MFFVISHLSKARAKQTIPAQSISSLVALDVEDGSIQPPRFKLHRNMSCRRKHSGWSADSRITYPTTHHVDMQRCLHSTDAGIVAVTHTQAHLTLFESPGATPDRPPGLHASCLRCEESAWHRLLFSVHLYHSRGRPLRSLRPCSPSDALRLLRGPRQESARSILRHDAKPREERRSHSQWKFQLVQRKPLRCTRSIAKCANIYQVHLDRGFRLSCRQDDPFYCAGSFSGSRDILLYV